MTRPLAFTQGMGRRTFISAVAIAQMDPFTEADVSISVSFDVSTFQEGMVVCSVRLRFRQPDSMTN